ncbi:unnamed protein product, partial [Didymodactylos carnosus]
MRARAMRSPAPHGDLGSPEWPVHKGEIPILGSLR